MLNPSVEPGEVVAMEVPPGVNRLTLKRGNQTLSTSEVDATGRVLVTAPNELGNYGVYFGNSEKQERMLHVNAPVKESELVYTTEQPALSAWKRLPVEGKESVEKEKESLPEGIRRLIFQQKYWWWLLLVGGLALVAEMVCLIWRKGKAHV